jgi:hypothetical protein
VLNAEYCKFIAVVLSERNISNLFTSGNISLIPDIQIAEHAYQKTKCRKDKIHTKKNKYNRQLIIK